mgnify:CR=1 FL=1
MVPSFMEMLDDPAATEAVVLDAYVPTLITANNSISYPNGTNFAIGSAEGRVALNITRCNGVQCANGGSCDTGVCTCAAGFSGSRCEIDLCTGVACPLGHRCQLGQCVLDLCYRVYCRNDGKCDQGRCTCVNGFSGSLCEVDPCTSLQCQNGGLCKLPGQCHCLNGFSGSTCEIDSCFNVPCANGGKCMYGKCICPPEYEGVDCTIKTEALKDQEQYSAKIGKLEGQIGRTQVAVDVIRNAVDPAAISATFAEVFRYHAEHDMEEAVEKARQDWLKPQVRGVAPVRRRELKMPNTPYENAKIYEDQALAYAKGHETRQRKFVDALKLINVTDENLKYRKESISKDVPGAENISTPFGRFAQIHDKYAPDVSLLEADLAQHRAERAELAQSILAADDLLV